jgi:hypothetical protein
VRVVVVDKDESVVRGVAVQGVVARNPCDDLGHGEGAKTNDLGRVQQNRVVSDSRETRVGAADE